MIPRRSRTAGESFFIAHEFIGSSKVVPSVSKLLQILDSHLTESPLQIIDVHPGNQDGITLWVKRDDLIHSEIHGNKWRKLAPVLPLLRSNPRGVLTFGGPFSNHLHAVAAAGRVYNFPTVGIVRGAHIDLNNPTMTAARQNGMQLIPVPKKEYDAGKDKLATWAGHDFSKHFFLPEGGSTALAVESCAAIAQEIIRQLPHATTASPEPFFICVPAGTGCTAAGIINGTGATNGQVLVFPVVNNGFDQQTILSKLREAQQHNTATINALQDKFRLVQDYEFGGFAKKNPVLLDFAYAFRQQTGILPDPVYTAKMLYGIYDMLEKKEFPANSTIVAVHTGGLQGWGGFEGRE